MTRRPAQIILAVTLAAGALAGCGTQIGQGGPDIPRPTSSKARTIGFELYTHCGIDEARIGSTYYEAETPLSDGSGNPPDGWDNPTQLGTMTLTSDTEAVFTDDAGHRVKFRARPGARDFKHICA